jgi:hypothetical protein
MGYEPGFSPALCASSDEKPLSRPSFAVERFCARFVVTFGDERVGVC